MDSSPVSIPSELNQTPKSTYAFDVFKLISGNTVAQGLTVLASPFLTRQYSPEAFGLMTLFISITGIMKVISCLRYEFSIVLPKSDEDGANLLGGSLLVVTVISIFSGVFFLIFGGAFLNLLNASELKTFLWMMPLTIFSGGIFLALNYWNTRTKNFGRLSIAQVLNSLTVVIGQLVLGYAGFKTSGSLIGSYVLGASFAALVLGGQIWRDDGKFLLKTVRFSSIVEQLKRYRKFPLYDSWAALLNNISWQLPSFLLAMFFSKTEVGYYALSFRLLNLPMSLIGISIGQVFFQRAAEAKIHGELSKVVESNFRYLVVIGLMPFFLLSIVGKDLFSVVFGANWSEAGVYAQILSIWIFFWFISSPLSTLFRVLERQKFSLVLNIVIFITRILALSIGGVLGSARLALFLFALSGVVLYGFLSISIGIASGVPQRRIWWIILSNALICLPAGGVLLAFKHFSFPAWSTILAAGLIGLGYFVFHGIFTFGVQRRFKELYISLKR